jgi:uncharacterized OB-fold protein
MSRLEQTFEEAPPAWPGLWGRDAEGAYLVAGQCGHCGGLALGLREFCPHCRHEGSLCEARVGRKGLLYTATVVHQGPSGFKAPYRIGYVDIEGGIRVFAHLDNGPAAPQIGDPVTLDVQPLAADKAGRLMTVPIYARSRRETAL